MPNLERAANPAQSTALSLLQAALAAIDTEEEEGSEFFALQTSAGTSFSLLHMGDNNIFSSNTTLEGDTLDSTTDDINDGGHAEHQHARLAAIATRSRSEEMAGSTREPQQHESPPPMFFGPAPADTAVETGGEFQIPAASTVNPRSARPSTIFNRQHARLLHG